MIILQQSSPGQSAEDNPSAVMPEKYRSFFDSYCLKCHDSENQEGGVVLQELTFDLGTLESAELWQKILSALNSGDMPPPSSTQPPAQAKTEFLADLSKQLVVARKLLSDSGGVITMRRLNRREYRNSIRSLLGVEVDVSELPDDANSGGFDTAGASLFFSSDQFEKYLAIGRQALDQAIITGQSRQRMRRTRQAEVAASKYIRQRFQALLSSHQRAEKWRASNRPPADFGFIDAARVKFEDDQYARRGPGFEWCLKHPASATGAILATFFAGMYIDVTDIPAAAPPGRYLLRVHAGVLKNAPQSGAFLELGIIDSSAQRGEMSVLACRSVRGTINHPEMIEFPITVTASGSRRFGLRERQHNSRDAARLRFLAARRNKQPLPAPTVWIDKVEWEGPLNDPDPLPPDLRIGFSGTNQVPPDAHTRRIIRNFAVRAFRNRAPDEVYVDRLMDLFRARLEDGEPFAEAIRTPLSVILASPAFLYMIEPAWKQEARQLTERQFAIRLSFFLWSSPPDAALYRAARDGDLRRPEGLRNQVNRMLRDPKSREFISGFTNQWLQLERLDFFQFNSSLYPDFDESVRQAARQEVYHSFETVLRENLTLHALLNPDFIVVNDLLAHYYGIPDITGHQFRKVPIPPESPRGGLTGMAAILAMGSDGERSSPVERGAWVMRKLLHDPPPPAPANVPQLDRLAGKLLPARKLQTAHMTAPQCAQCHRRIDPIGYGLENFDAAGRWRNRELTQIVARKGIVKQKKLHPIDASGTLPDGTPFADFFELRKRLAERQPSFARSCVESLIAYSLGRPYGFTDQDLAEEILAGSGDQTPALQDFIHTLVQSRQFRTK